MGNWSGIIIKEEQYVICSDWYWGDAKFKKRCRDILTYRKFFTEPKPPMADMHFFVRPVFEDVSIECYSTGDCLISLEPKKETEVCYSRSFLDRLKALFFS